MLSTQYNTNTRTENQVKSVKELLTSLAISYRDGSMFHIQKKIKDTKAGPKEAFIKSNVVRSSTVARIQENKEIATVNDVVRSYDIFNKPTHFAGLNVYGSILDVATYFGERLFKDSTNLERESGLFALAALLCKLVKSGSDFVVDDSNCTTSGYVKVLAGLDAYATIAEEDKVRKEECIDYLYRTFVLEVFDVITADMKASILAWMQQHGYGVASNYNSQEAVRATVRATLMKGLDGFDETAKLYAACRNAVDSVGSPLDRLEWVKVKAVHKKRSDENHITLEDLPKLALDVGVLTDVVANVPVKFRSDCGTDRTTYSSELGLLPSHAHKLWYMFGVTPKPAKIDASHTESSEGGKRRVKTLNHVQIQEKLSEQIKKYFDADPKGVTNIGLLLEDKKYLDISDAVPTIPKGIQLTAKTANTILLFPGQQSGSFQKIDCDNRQTLFTFILSHAGYSRTSKIAPGHIGQVLASLYEVFDQTMPSNLHINTVPQKTNTSGVFSAFSAAPVTAPAVCGFPSQAYSSMGGSI